MRTWRRLLGSALAVVVLAGCSDADPEDDPTSGSNASESGADSGSEETAGTAGTAGTPETTEPTAPTRPPLTHYRPNPAEVDVAAKRVAARAVEDLPEVRQVTYTQYFGYLPPSASILVEADFAEGGGTTYDVRIGQDGSSWRVDSITPADPPTPLKEPGPLIRRVLESDRIALPWAGRDDVAAGRVDDEVLRSMLAVAAQHRITVSVLISAHPVLVFGTDRRSRHPDGFAYDVGSIDGKLVVDPGTARLVRQVMELATSTGADQVGGPVDLDGGGSQYFSDLTHSDHVHVGFDG